MDSLFNGKTCPLRVFSFSGETALLSRRFGGHGIGIAVSQQRKHPYPSKRRNVGHRFDLGFGVRAAANFEDYKEKQDLADNPFFKMVAEDMNVEVEEEGSKKDVDDGTAGAPESEELQRKTTHFERIQDVPAEERDRVQKQQVIDRAGAALAAANALMAELSHLRRNTSEASSSGSQSSEDGSVREPKKLTEGKPVPWTPSYGSQSDSSLKSTPGPDFWSWSPPPSDGQKQEPTPTLTPKLVPETKELFAAELLEKENSEVSLGLPFQSRILSAQHSPFVLQKLPGPSLPPLQSVIESANTQLPALSISSPAISEEKTFQSITELSDSQNASEIASILDEDDQKQKTSTNGVNPDGSRWWKETGVEHRANGVTCNWTVLRGVSSNGDTEWEEKFWEAYDDFDYKELGSEKSGRDATGNVWREFWKESMWQDVNTGLLHIEKTADKWAKNGQNAEWQEKWWEHYDARGHTEKWADKWCQIDLNTPLEDGHAHVWHERWGEKFDGRGSCMKYTDKWAERLDGEGWSKWGDKWDEHFEENGHGVKQGETWWEGRGGEKWNRTWGEQHNGSGSVHKYGKSSSGEHWDVFEEQETWYEKHPHFGFSHAYENSQALRSVHKHVKPKL